MHLEEARKQKNAMVKGMALSRLATIYYSAILRHCFYFFGNPFFQKR